MGTVLILRGRHWAVSVLRGSLLIAVITFVAFRAHLNSAATGFAYLICIVLNCLDCGMVPATGVSVLAVGCLDYFFIQPLFTFTVADPVDVAALAAFLTTSLAVSRLASRAREEAKSAEQERANLARLYELAVELVALDPLRDHPTRLLNALQSVYRLQAVSIFDAATAEIHVCGESRIDIGALAREAYIAGADMNEPRNDVAVRCIRTSGTPIGVLGLEGLPGAKTLAGPIVALVTAALDRVRAIRSASEAAAEVRTEALRTAILDALAHEFKTPVATILTAAGGLLATAPLTPVQSELAALLESEAARLSELGSRLLRLSRLDSQEVKPKLRPFDLHAGLASLVERYRNQFPDRTFDFVATGEPVEAAADAELFELAAGQLLDNACRYSPPLSQIKVNVEFTATCASVIVWNSGSSIPSAERSRIFERFYRGADGRRTASGTGLGLYVARKIAAAHGGTLEMDFNRSKKGVAFRLAFPISSQELNLEKPASACVDRG
jgi:two-component system sensor histidine kinase KdpD